MELLEKSFASPHDGGALSFFESRYDGHFPGSLGIEFYQALWKLKDISVVCVGWFVCFSVQTKYYFTYIMLI